MTQAAVPTERRRRLPTPLVWTVTACAGIALLGMGGVAVLCALARLDVITDWDMDPDRLKLERVRPSLTHLLWIEFSSDEAGWQDDRLFWYLRPWRGTIVDYPGHPSP